ncbi:MAG: DUF309 domain-containing protein [Chloroflexi bacterium]|nr:DUF309 domain-containing protein [Chloroflexota bacterium]
MSDLERKLYYDGITLFNEHEFFDAHEAWEDIWHMAYGKKYYFYQGLIQCSVALEHYRRSNPRGVLSLFRTYNQKFAHVAEHEVFMGLEIKSFLEAMRTVLAPVLDADPVPEKGAIQLDPSRAPKIALKYDPFATGEASIYSRPS